MATFVTGKELEDCIYDIIWTAQDTLLILSPYIKLDEYFKTLFDNHVNNHKLHIIIVFGKNEASPSKSLNKTDIDFFKRFLNVSVVYVPNLHAKYYGNESKGVITSINLYDASFKNNIEYGIYSEMSILANNSIEKQAWQTSHEVASMSEALFIKRPVYEKNMLSVITGKKYIKSDTLLDNTDKIYKSLFSRQSNKFQTIEDFPSELEMGASQNQRPTREDVESLNKGYCIRTGIEIPFNPKRPLSEGAYKSWATYKNLDYPENYCHKTGKKSNGKTSVRNPIL